MKFKKILLASVIAIFLSLINLNIYNSNPNFNLTNSSTVSNISQISQLSFAPSFGVEKSYAHCKWSHPHHCVVQWVQSAAHSIGDILQEVGRKVLEVIATVSTSLAEFTEDTVGFLVGIFSATNEAVEALFKGNSVLEGWNCGYLDGTGVFHASEEHAFFGGTCVSPDKTQSFSICKSDGKTPYTGNDIAKCPAAQHACELGVQKPERVRRSKLMSDNQKESERVRIGYLISNKQTRLNYESGQLASKYRQIATENQRWDSASSTPNTGRGGYVNPPGSELRFHEEQLEKFDADLKILNSEISTLDSEIIKLQTEYWLVGLFDQKYVVPSFLLTDTEIFKEADFVPAPACLKASTGALSKPCQADNTSTGQRIITAYRAIENANILKDANFTAGDCVGASSWAIGGCLRAQETKHDRIINNYREADAQRKAVWLAANTVDYYPDRTYLDKLAEELDGLNAQVKGVNDQITDEDQKWIQWRINYAVTHPVGTSVYRARAAANTIRIDGFNKEIEALNSKIEPITKQLEAEPVLTSTTTADIACKHKPTSFVK